MYVTLQEWCIEVRSALPKKQTNLQKVAEEMGSIIECERKSSKSAEIFNIVGYDQLYNFQKSSDNVYFAKGKKTKSILTSLGGIKDVERIL